jgi:3-hydroxybutyrate dehydrogenase
MIKGRPRATGSTSGIGLAIAHSLGREGYNIVINGYDEKIEIEKIRASVEKDFRVKALYSPADMTKPADIADMIHTTEKQFGALDILINNDGIQFVANVENFPSEKWNAVVATNLSSVFTIRAAVPGMKKRKWGRIINIVSAHGLRASTQKVAYVAAKHGLVGLTKSP